MKLKEMYRNTFAALGLLSSVAVVSICPPLHAAEQYDDISGDVMVFHAGSLAVPFKEVVKAFNKEYPRVRVLSEASGSRAAARKISDLNRDADVFGSADYTVIDTLLIPAHASWTIRFAANEMVLAYTGHSRRAGEIDGTNWHHLLLDENVAYGRSDPNSDPCG